MTILLGDDGWGDLAIDNLPSKQWETDFKERVVTRS